MWGARGPDYTAVLQNFNAVVHKNKDLGYVKMIENDRKIEFKVKN